MQLTLGGVTSRSKPAVVEEVTVASELEPGGPDFFHTLLLRSLGEIISWCRIGNLHFLGIFRDAGQE